MASYSGTGAKASAAPSSGGGKYGSMGNPSMAMSGMYSLVGGLLQMYIQQEVQRYIEEAALGLAMYGGMGMGLPQYGMSDSSKSQGSAKPSKLENIAGSGGSTPYVSAKK
jgi:hypothetical protein